MRRTLAELLVAYVVCVAVAAVIHDGHLGELFGPRQWPDLVAPVLLGAMWGYRGARRSARP
jgi:hypothetical protein